MLANGFDLSAGLDLSEKIGSNVATSAAERAVHDSNRFSGLLLKQYLCCLSGLAIGRIIRSLYQIKK
jgi:hypothetical protein